jgi:N-acyl-D-amino-acid deacylase
VALPWVSFGSDEASYTNEGVFLKSNAHPRAYGNFVRVIGHYARDEKVLKPSTGNIQTCQTAGYKFKIAETR